MRNWKRILAGVGTAALLFSSVGAVSQAAFAAETGTEETAGQGSESGSRTDKTANQGGETGSGSEQGSQQGAGDGSGKSTNVGDESGTAQGTNAGAGDGSSGTAQGANAGAGDGSSGTSHGTNQGGENTSGSSDGGGTNNGSGQGTGGGSGTNETGDTGTGGNGAGATGDGTDGDTSGQTGNGTPQDAAENNANLIGIIPDGDGTSLASITGNTTVKVGDSIQLSCEDCRYGQYSRGTKTWTSSDTSIAMFSSGDNTSRPSLRGIAKGIVTITHTHSDRSGNTQTSTYTVTVTGNEQPAGLYALKDPDADPDKNNNGKWTTLLGAATVDTTGATWVQSSDWSGAQNIMQNVAQYIVSWPDGSTGSTWTLVPGGTYFNTVWNQVQSTYEEQLKAKLGITEDMSDYVTDLILTPHKISKGNGTSTTNPYDMHVDMTLNIKVTRNYTVLFHVKEVGESDYDVVHTVDNQYTMSLNNYTPTAQPVQKYIYEDNAGNQYDIGATKAVNGVTYRLTGWYIENDAGGARSDDTADFSGNGYELRRTYETDDSGNQVIKDLPELKDLKVNFYAEWVPVTGDLEVTKNVDATSGFYDPDAKYQIKIHVDGAAGKIYGNYTFDSNGDYIVTLANGETATIPEIDSGTSYTVTEVAASSEGFDVSYDETCYRYDDDGNEVTITDATPGIIYPDGITKVTVTNTRKVVKTGVTTTAPPTAAMAAAILMLAMGTTAYYKVRRSMHG